LMVLVKFSVSKYVVRRFWLIKYLCLLR
jgi:hypothetical protein